MTQPSDLFLLGDVARRLGCRPHRIAYLLTSGLVPEPALRLGNRRVFDEGDIGRIIAQLGRRTKEINE
jgi:DNA-binding transcriptional MerR regulator